MYIMKCKYEEIHFLHPLFKTFEGRELMPIIMPTGIMYLSFFFNSHYNCEGDVIIILFAMGT
jgi:hypothetical protein